MRLVDADALEVVGTIIPSDIDAKSYVMGMEYILNKIDSLPTIEPERKTGKWVELGENPDGTHNICCGYCGVGKYKSKGHANSEYTKQRFKFCPKCGAKMEEGGQDG